MKVLDRRRLVLLRLVQIKLGGLFDLLIVRTGSASAAIALRQSILNNLL